MLEPTLSGPAVAVPKSLSVVIATLGGPTLGPSIERLNQGSVVPAEILICIPASESHRVQKVFQSNVRVIVTTVRGQVAQRAEGFKLARGHFVMQMDDDMHLAEDCVECLLETLARQGPHCAVAPALYVANTGRSVYDRPPGPAWAASLYYWLMNGEAGFQGGGVDRACGAMGVDPLREPPGLSTKTVEWLPGGCVLQAREDLVSGNFFPFPGKAYCEDIIHSYLRKKQGVEMYVDLKARCDIEVVYAASKDLWAFFRDLRNDAKVRFYYAKLTGRSRIRLAQYYLVTVAVQLGRRVVRKGSLALERLIPSRDRSSAGAKP
jgi:glycosyltransferase involved in cell wall biosynthesis